MNVSKASLEAQAIVTRSLRSERQMWRWLTALFIFGFLVSEWGWFGVAQERDIWKQHAADAISLAGDYRLEAEDYKQESHRWERRAGHLREVVKFYQADLRAIAKEASDCEAGLVTKPKPIRRD